MEKNLLTVQDVSELLRVHKNTIYKLIHTGQLRAFKVGRAWRFKFEDVWDFWDGLHDA